LTDILLTGGAGYIGAHMAKMLVQSGYEVIILDNISTGIRDAVRYGRLVEGDLADLALLQRIFAENEIMAVMHFAALSQVGESMRKPALYYRNNVSNAQNVLDAMLQHGVRHFILSSTAAIFGEPQYTPIDEAHLRLPVNTYGRSKHLLEEILADYSRSYDLRFVSLRYFNAAGADPEGELGERHEPESHLIPLVLQVASGRRDHVDIYGDDYPTPDGTCIRDYIHVWDLCSAHLRALEYLLAGGESCAFNLGNGTGVTVQEVIDMAKCVTDREVQVRKLDRRDGDPSMLVANSTKARVELGWHTEFQDLRTIIEHAWQWERTRGAGW